MSTFDPLDFAFSPALFRGLPGSGWDKGLIVTDLDVARELAFAQTVPVGYQIWLDVIENIRAILRKNPRFDAAKVLVDDYLRTAQGDHATDHVGYRKKKLRKESTPFEDFLFSDARDDAYFVLSTVAIYRELGGDVRASLLEDIFAIYRDGGWPCGMKGESLVVFDPVAIPGPRHQAASS